MKFQEILFLFLTWRLSLFFIAFVATILIPNFASQFPYAETVLKPTNLPEWIWGFGNFDGVHYLRLAQNGYSSDFTQAFFPLYSLIISLIKSLLFFYPGAGLDLRFFVDPVYFYIGLLVSNTLCLLMLFIMYKLFRLDFSKSTSQKALLLTLAFPTAFYFGSIYNESLFIFLTILCFYFQRRKMWIFAGVCALLASSTRLIGIFLVLSLFISIIIDSGKVPKINRTQIIGLLIAPLGLIIYMLYLNQNYSNPFYFITAQPSFGAERSVDKIILLPQVIYRYIKILIDVPLTQYTAFTALNELLFNLFSFGVLLALIHRIPLNISSFVFLSLLIPTLTGTFSSMPRYSLVLVLLFPYLVGFLGRRWIILAIFFMIIQIFLTSLFVRGYWIA